MSQGNKETIAARTHGKHFWLSSKELTLDDVLEACPQAVIGKYLAITSIDSGSYFPNEEEKRAGWEHREGVAYIPRVASPDVAPHDGYDEWYLFNEPVDLGRLVRDQNIFEVEFCEGQVAAFVNFGPGFLLSAPNALTELFWKQYELIRPHCFISHGDVLNFVTSNRELFQLVGDSLKL